MAFLQYEWINLFLILIVVSNNFLIIMTSSSQFTFIRVKLSTINKQKIYQAVQYFSLWFETYMSIQNTSRLSTNTGQSIAIPSFTVMFSGNKPTTHDTYHTHNYYSPVSWNIQNNAEIFLMYILMTLNRSTPSTGPTKTAEEQQRNRYRKKARGVKRW